MMAGTLVGYARCSTDSQDLTAQRGRLRQLGVPDELVYMTTKRVAPNAHSHDSTKRWLPSGMETLSSFQNWIAWPDRYPMPVRSLAQTQGFNASPTLLFEDPTTN